MITEYEMSRPPLATQTRVDVTAHNALTGLTGDDHVQYHTDARGDARYEALGAVSAHAATSDPHPQYLTPAEANALYAPIGGGGGGSVISAVATVTVPWPGDLYFSGDVALVGCTSDKKIMCSLAPHLDTDENDPEFLGISSMSALAGLNVASVKLAFSEITSGPIKLNLMAV